jgi:hypothetical protein
MEFVANSIDRIRILTGEKLHTNLLLEFSSQGNLWSMVVYFSMKDVAED